MVVTTIPANTPSPVPKDNFINTVSQPSVATGGEFVVLYNYLSDTPLLYATTSGNGYFITNVTDLKIDSYFEDMTYKASIRNYELPDKSLKAVLGGVLHFFKCKKIKLNKSFPFKDGGIGLDFRVNNTKYLVELYNDNEDVFSIEEQGQPIKAWDLNHSKILKTINSHIG